MSVSLTLSFFSLCFINVAIEWMYTHVSPVCSKTNWVCCRWQLIEKWLHFDWNLCTTPAAPIIKWTQKKRHSFKLSNVKKKKLLIYLLFNKRHKKQCIIISNDECVIDDFRLYTRYCVKKSTNQMIFIRAHVCHLNWTVLNEIIRNYSEIISIWKRMRPSRREKNNEQKQRKKEELFSTQLRKVDFLTLRLWVIDKVFHDRVSLSFPPQR